MSPRTVTLGPRRTPPPRGSAAGLAPRIGRQEGPSAAFALGTMAGVLAAVGFLPTSLPLLWQIMSSEQDAAVHRCSTAAYSIAAGVRQGSWPEESSMQAFGMQAVRVERSGQPPSQVGRELPAAPSAELCTQVPPHGVITLEDGARWVAACAMDRELKVLAAQPLEALDPVRRAAGMVLLLGAVVGIVTALSILRLLRPLSMVSSALDRVGAGERGVSLPQTGLLELDQLVSHLNAAARSVDDREDAILARIALVQDMSRIVAHEVRNPLQSIELLASLVALEDDPAERKGIAASIHAEIASLEQVVTRLLRESTSKGSLRLQLTTQPLAPLVNQVVALRKPQAQQLGVHLGTGELAWVEAAFDQTLLKRSVENLVLNALQAAPRVGGEVRVSIREEGDGLTLLVEDNGPGVPDHLSAAIFEPNVTHGKAGGVGLGLALVKGVVEAHRGYVRCERSELGGACFRAWIPTEQGRSEESRESHTPAQIARIHPSHPNPGGG